MRALKKVFQRRNKFLSDQETDIGNVLLRLGYLDEDQLHLAVRIQKDRADIPESQGPKLLGQILVSLGIIGTPELEAALVAQEKLRNGGAADVMVDRMQRRSLDWLNELTKVA